MTAQAKGIIMTLRRVTLLALASLLTVDMTSIAELQQAETHARFAPIGAWGGVWGTSSNGSWCAALYPPEADYVPATDYPNGLGYCGHGYYPSEPDFSRSR